MSPTAWEPRFFAHGRYDASEGHGMRDHATKAKEMLDSYLSYGGFGRVEREARVWPGRRFRADWFLPDQEPPVVVEYDSLMGGGGHASVGGILRDAEKGNLAQASGLRFYRFNARVVHNGEAFSFLDGVLDRIPPPGSYKRARGVAPPVGADEENAK